MLPKWMGIGKDYEIEIEVKFTHNQEKYINKIIDIIFIGRWANPLNFPNFHICIV